MGDGRMRALQIALRSRRRFLGVGLALLAVYFIWGSTYLANHVALQGFPALLMSGIRFAVAGGALYLCLRARGTPRPSRAQWAGAAVVGCLLPAVGSGGAAFAQQWVASGLAAVAMATIPLWAALFAGLWERWPTRREWGGLALGFLGVGLLNLDEGLRAHPVGAVVLLLAAASWGFGSIWSRHLPVPSGPMGSAMQMLAAGALLMLLSVGAGERMRQLPTGPSLVALGYLVVFGSLVAYSAYHYLLHRVRPALATSYAYVNPVVAVALGVALAGEHVSGTGVLAMVVILIGVGLVIGRG
jgi:drug/metabolite transporter (DMT)-like permease